MKKTKKLYYVEYWDRKHKICHTTIKATSEYDAERRFYKKDSYSLIRKISLI